MTHIFIFRAKHLRKGMYVALNLYNTKKTTSKSKNYWINIICSVGQLGVMKTAQLQTMLIRGARNKRRSYKKTKDVRYRNKSIKGSPFVFFLYDVSDDCFSYLLFTFWCWLYFLYLILIYNLFILKLVSVQLGGVSFCAKRWRQ